MNLKKATCGLLACLLSVSFFGCSSEQTVEERIVYMPDGAPALSMAYLMKGDTETDGVTYKVVNPTLISTKVTATDESKNADLCVLPLTAASKLLGAGDKYQLVATLTHGNLYLISKTAGSYTKDNLSDLIGKTVGVLQIKEVPGLTFKTALYNAQVPFKELTTSETAVADKVNLRPITSPADMATVVADCYLLAEPAVTAQLKNYSIVGNLQEIYGEGGFPQAVLVAKKSLIATDSAFVTSFLQSVKQSCDNITALDGATLVQTVTAHLEDKSYSTTLKAPLLTEQTLLRCGVRYDGDPKEKVLAYLTSAKAVQSAITVPNDSFFWSANN